MLTCDVNEAMALGMLSLLNGLHGYFNSRYNVIIYSHNNS